MMNEDDIRGLNCDFNYHNYGIFYERIDEETNAVKEDGESPEKEGQSDRDAIKPNCLVGFQKLVSDQNLLNKMWQNVDVDFDGFKERYEEWLEEEVWTYFD